jgi:cellulose synthase operon protein C
MHQAVKDLDAMGVIRRWVAAGLIVGAVLPGCSDESPERLIASAKEYLAQGNRPAAVIQLKNALGRDSTSGEARFLLGKTFLDNDDLVAGAIELQKARDLQYAPEVVSPLLARAWFHQGQFRKVVDTFAETTLTDRAAAADLKTVLAQAYAAQGLKEPAAKALADALRTAPEHVPALLLEARRLAAVQDFDGALRLTDRILSTESANHDAWQLKGNLLAYVKNDRAGALNAYRRAIAARPDHVPSHAAVLSILLDDNDLPAATEAMKALHKVRPGHPTTRYLAARLAFQEGKVKAADEAVQALLKLAPSDPQLLQLAGSVAFRTGALLQAKQHLGKLLQGQPENVTGRRLLALTHFRSGDPSKALEVLKPLLESPDAGSPDVALAASAHWELGDLSKAEALYRRAVQMDPKDVRARTALAATSASKGDGAALAELEAIAAAESGISADLALITWRTRRNEFDAALTAIDRLEKKRPTEPLASHLRGRVLLLKGDVAEARKGFEKAVTIDDVYFPALASLSALDVRQHRYEQAEQRFAKLLQGNANHAQALTAIAAVRAAAGRGRNDVVGPLSKAIVGDPAYVPARVALVNYHLSGKDGARQGLEAAQAAVAAVPEDDDLLDALARAQRASGATNQAVATYNKMASLHPRSARPHIALADMHLAAKDTDLARQSLKKALDAEPDSLAAQRKMIALELGAGRSDAAMAIARAIQKKSPASGIGHAFEGDVRAFAKNWTAAAAAYRIALQKEPATEAARRLHAALKEAGNRRDADAVAASWLQAHPRDVSFMMHLAVSATADNDVASAERRLQQVVDLEPENSVAHNNLAWVLGRLKKPEAMKHAEKANALRPNQPSYMDTLAALLAEENKIAQAIDLQAKAVALQPDNNELRLSLAKLYVRAGNKEMARKELEPLGRLGDKFQHRSEVQNMLQQL